METLDVEIVLQYNVDYNTKTTEPYIYFNANHYLYRYHAQTKISTIIAGTGERCDSPDGTPQMSACFSGILNMYISPIDNQFYFLRNMDDDRKGASVNTFENGQWKLIAGGGKDKHSSLVSAKSIFITPFYSFLALGPDNSLYIADTHLRHIRIVYTNGTCEIIAGGLDNNDYGDDGIKATDAAISPTSVVVLSSGDFLFTEDNRIRKVSKKTGLVNTVYGQLHKGFTPDGDIQPGETSFKMPHLVSADPSGRNEILLLDQHDSNDYRTQIRKLETSCDLGEYLDPDWKNCLKCPTGTYSGSDFTECNGKMVYCNGLPFDSPNVCSSHGKCTAQSTC